MNSLSPARCSSPLWLWVLLLAVLTALAGCGGGDAPTPAESASTPDPAATPATPGPGAGAPVPDPAASAPATAAGPAVRLEISPPGGLIISTTERRALGLRAFDANGLEVPVPAGASVVSSNSGYPVRSSAGGGFELQATLIGSSTLVSAAVPGSAIASPPVLFYSAQPAAGALLVADSQVVVEPAPLDAAASRGLGLRYRTTLSGVGAPAPGSLMVGAGAQPIAGKVVSAAPNPANNANTDVVLELVPLHVLFSDLNVSAAYTTAEMTRMMVLAPGRKQIASAERLRRLSVPGAACKGDAPTLGVLTGELEAKVDPHLQFEMLFKIVNHAPEKMYFRALGSLDVAGKAVVNLGASVTGGVTCKATLGYIPIPITGPLSPFIAPIIPLDAKFELAAQVSVNAFSFAAEFKQSAELDFGFVYDATFEPARLEAYRSLQFTDPELTRSVTFPTQASLRVKATAFLGLSSGMALGGVLGRLEVIEVYAGPEFEIKFGGSYDVANDTVYASEYELKGKAGIGPGEHVQAFFEKVLLSPKAIDLSAKLEKSIARSAAPGSLGIDRETFVAGERLVFSINLDPSTVDFPLVGYNVKEVRVYRLRDAPSFSAQLVASATAAPGQAAFTLEWVSDFAGQATDPSGQPSFYAFVVDKAFSAISGSFPFELGPIRGRVASPQFKIAGTGTAAYAIDNGVLRAIGRNNGGALGAGLAIGADAPAPVTVPLADVRAVSGSAWHATALLGDGSVWSWGWGADIAVEGGAAVNNPLPLPVDVASDAAPLTGVVSISSGYTTSVAVKADGTVWQFGRSGPATRISGLPFIAAASQGGGHVLFLTDDGVVMAVGGNSLGQLGDGTGVSKGGPIGVPGMTNVIAIAAGGAHSLALKKDGSVWAWGHNSSGELGLGLTDSIVYVPTRISTLVGVSRISTGESHSMALANGVVYVWGYAGNNRIGDCGSVLKVLAPVAVLTGAIDIDGGEFLSMAVLAGGSVMYWGELLGVSAPCSPTASGLTAK